ncbi:MAG: ATP-binding protein [Vulcanimicrobiaceae bacterium]
MRKARTHADSNNAAAGSLPTGTVFFLFSDIEGSTARWEADRVAMQDAVRRHDAIVESAIERHGGYVFKTIGDAFCAAFKVARDALDAAVDAQRLLATEDWSLVNGLRVRIAVHAGDADERNGDYYGPAVNRVARLLATGHGGQVLLSGVAAGLLAESLPPDVTLRPLGTYRLKDLEQPERVFQVIARDLQADFKPLRSLEAVPNNLPRQATSLVGRDEDVQRVKDLLQCSSLVTITGTGGVGKTRVALQSAADVIDDMDDGTWFVNLAPIADLELVASTVLATLRVSQNADRLPLDVLIEYLKARRTLLLLDNCEHVIAEAAHIVSALVSACPQVTILATSREPLNIPGERTYALPSLGIAEAVRLFAQRAKESNPQFEITDSNAPVVENICRRLDGIPLAIELAAPRLRVVSVEELSRRLQERFRILTGGSRTALPRQQTMRALIDWSYDLLNDDEKALFRHIAIFRGRFTLEAATAVCADETIDEWSILDLLSSLTDKSLIVADIEQSRQRYHLLESIHEYALERLNEESQQRYHMHQTVKKYAAERIEEWGERDVLAQRHASFFAALARAAYEEWDTAPRPEWLELLAPDLDNLRAALEWGLEARNDIELGAQIMSNALPIFLRLSLLREAIRWGEAALEAVPDMPPALQARLLYVLSMVYNNQGSLKKALAAVDSAVALYRQTEDARGLTRALSQLGQHYSRQSRTEEALACAQEALERARAIGDRRLLAGILRRCAFVLEPDDIERAREQFKESVSLFRSLHENDETALSLGWWAEAEGAAGCINRALDLSLEALQLADQGTKMYALTDIAGYAVLLDEEDRVRSSAREALALAAEQHHQLIVALNTQYLASIVCRNDPALAARLLGYSKSRILALDWQSTPTDRIACERLTSDLRARLGEAALQQLFSEGAAWTDEDALEHTSNV